MPGGIGSDRASMARRRAEAKIRPVCEASPDGSGDASNGAVSTQGAASGSIPTITEMLRKLLDDVDGEFATHEAHLRNAMYA